MEGALWFYNCAPGTLWDVTTNTCQREEDVTCTIQAKGLGQNLPKIFLASAFPVLLLKCGGLLEPWLNIRVWFASRHRQARWVAP